jgi:hypothetical protein
MSVCVGTPAGDVHPISGRVDYLDAYIVGRAKLIVFYRQLLAAYPDARLISVVQDNWSIHTHVEVQAALAALPLRRGSIRLRSCGAGCASRC